MNTPKKMLLVVAGMARPLADFNPHDIPWEATVPSSGKAPKKSPVDAASSRHQPFVIC
jgi:hypothetical protein